MILIAVSIPVVWAPWQPWWLVAQGYRSLSAKNFSVALSYYDRAAAKAPNNAHILFTRALILADLKQYALTKAAYLKAVEAAHGDVNVANGFAWLLCTSPDDSVRDGGAAVEYARTACELTHWQSAACLDTYAAALADTNDFDDAVKWAEKAVEVAQDKALYQEHLNAFRSSHPWRDPK